jgi:hypothetical protein
MTRSPITDRESVNPFVFAAEGTADVATTTVVAIGAGTEDRPGFVVPRRAENLARAQRGPTQTPRFSGRRITDRQRSGDKPD